MPADVWAFGELGNEPGGLHASDSDRVVSNPDGPAAAAADPSAASVAEEGGDAVGSGDVAASALAGDVYRRLRKAPSRSAVHVAQRHRARVYMHWCGAHTRDVTPGACDSDTNVAAAGV